MLQTVPDLDLDSNEPISSSQNAAVAAAAVGAVTSLIGSNDSGAPTLTSNVNNFGQNDIASCSSAATVAAVVAPPPLMGRPSELVDGTPAKEDDLEIWVETKTAEGKSYYYHAKSRDTTWTKPEGENIKIISQEQVSEN